MSDVVIKVENLSKQYRLGTVGTGTLSHDLNRLWAKVRGKEDPYLKIGESNDRTLKGDSEYVWALQNMNFEVKRGEMLGVIGRNGAGKSTLLKILSQITRPTTGSVSMKGRVGSLLEVGTGFHPDLTGRENIYINGAILGMRKWEINKRLDEIIDFAGVERYLDTPVKRYSSGMKVRLGFAVAAHLEPEILIVDEVLAVGDAEFQKKCFGKMEKISKENSRTILLVSHSMDAIEKMASRVICLDKGMLQFDGNATEGIDKYLDKKELKKCRAEFNTSTFERYGDRKFGELLFVESLNSKNELQDNFFFQDEMIFKVGFKLNRNFNNPEIGICINNPKRARLHHLVSHWKHDFGEIKEGYHEVLIRVPNLKLYPGTYSISAWMRCYKAHSSDDFIEDVLVFNVRPNSSLKEVNFSDYAHSGGVWVDNKWELLS
ncbi:ABC transporter ATP-binding protein [Peredibacter starrii]|uniref:ABC transporter ATP-binding protein n=1 Tax=Peredibacter starrii TaxID=28202 RepID=A0AAX4HSE6_9BACT|nr:ABC transporter ATP-binding protein [Peredibacter starrii]WPU65829.1 ABC transporter ATP-binding protein [Peredibacter starrii]